MKLTKIPLEEFLAVLTKLFEDGVDYIDIQGEQSIEEDGSPKDIVKISIRPDYMSTADLDDEEENPEEDDIKLLSSPKIDVITETDFDDLTI